MSTTEKTKGPNIKRLRKMANYLEGLKSCDIDKEARGFSFSKVYVEESRDYNGHLCGTVGCAMGHADIVFPRTVHIQYIPSNCGVSFSLKLDGGRTYANLQFEKAAYVLFNLPNNNVANWLFDIGDKTYLKDTVETGLYLGRESSPAEVAEHIRYFMRNWKRLYKEVFGL